MSLSAEHRSKISRTLTGRKRSPEVCAKISATKRGQTISPEQRAKISAALKGRKASPERSFNSRVAERVIKLFKPEAYEAKRARAGEQMRRLWQDPVFRAAREAAQQARWERYRAERQKRKSTAAAPQAMEVGT
jgi:hypothetical protein